MNNRERELWIMNDEGLYNWFKSSRLSLHNFIKEFRNQIDGIIEKNAPKKTDTIDHGTYTFTIYQESKNTPTMQRLRGYPPNLFCKFRTLLKAPFFL